MARTPKLNRKPLSITLSTSNFATLEEERWNLRKTLSEVLDAAVEEYITNHNLTRVVVVDEKSDAKPAEAKK